MWSVQLEAAFSDPFLELGLVNFLFTLPLRLWFLEFLVAVVPHLKEVLFVAFSEADQVSELQRVGFDELKSLDLEILQNLLEIGAFLGEFFLGELHMVLRGGKLE